LCTRWFVDPIVARFPVLTASRQGLPLEPRLFSCASPPLAFVSNEPADELHRRRFRTNGHPISHQKKNRATSPVKLPPPRDRTNLFIQSQTVQHCPNKLHTRCEFRPPHAP